jgi:hypothetical protein
MMRLPTKSCWCDREPKDGTAVRGDSAFPSLNKGGHLWDVHRISDESCELDLKAQG